MRSNRDRERLFAFLQDSRDQSEKGWMGLLLIAVTILNSFARNLLTLTQDWLPAWPSALILCWMLLVFGFLLFRFVIKVFVLPYEIRS